jgi:predicted  nucleic acid-binding Zn-ribbon protein
MAAMLPMAPGPHRGTTGSIAAMSEVEELRAEVERLRALVGPTETAYEQLLADVAGAREAARTAEAEAGALRGTIAELHVQLARARQDQDRWQRARDAADRARARGVTVARRFVRR